LPKPWATTYLGCYGQSNALTSCETASIYQEAKANASRTGATAIGMGMANTTAIVARHSGVDKSTYAAGIADSLYVGGKSDWFLPSKDELNQMYIQNFTLGGIITGPYWSSSESDASGAWYVYPELPEATDFKRHGNFFFPIRAF
jgi:hypothetical protein